MKAIITAGGQGTRLRPITSTLNKHLIHIASNPMIFYAIKHLANAGIKEIGININVGEKELQAAVGNGKKWGVKITYIEQTGGALGLAHILKVWKKWIGKSSFVFYLGDNILLEGVDRLISKFKKENLDALLALSEVPDPQRFGVPTLKNGKITKVDEKPARPKSNFAVTGLYIYNSNVFSAVGNIKPSARGEYEISDVHTYLIKNKFKVGYEEITGWWKDTGKPYDILEGNQMMLSGISRDIHKKSDISKDSIIQGDVSLGKGVKILGSSIVRGPVSIGDNSIIKDSYIAPFTSIGEKVRVINSEIEHSIVMNNTVIDSSKNIGHRTRIVDSLIGANVSITPKSDTFPSGHKLIVGENSSVEL